MAAAEAEAAEAANAPPIAEVELTAEQEDLLASFLSDVTQVSVCLFVAAKNMIYASLGATKTGSRARVLAKP